MPRTRLKQLRSQRGAALFTVLMIAGLMSALVGLMAISFTGQNNFNRRNWKHDRALMTAEMGIQRAVTGLAHTNDGMSWNYKNLTAAPAAPPASFWLWQWQTIKNEQGVETGRYQIEILPSGSNHKLMRLKATAMVYDRIQNGKAEGVVQRAFGVELRQLTLGDFAIATNHQLGGARINGGARVYGGLLTSGEVHLDASSTGIYNEYVDLQTSQNFAGYGMPEDKPSGEVFVYKDPTLPAGASNGTIRLAAQATLGTAGDPMQGIHTAEDSTVQDPGDGSPGSEGDGILGQGQDRAKGPRDHKLPDIQFPDASSGSTFMDAREIDAAANGNAVYTGDLEFGTTSFSIGSGPALSYDGTTGIITVSGPIFIKGNVKSDRPLRYSGKGGLFVDGDFTAREGVEPVDPAGYGSTHALGVVASDIMELGRHSGDSSHYAGFFFGNNTLKVEKAKIFGNLFGNTIQLPTAGTRPDIYVHPGVMAATGVELPDFVKAEIVRNLWWELSGSAALGSS